MEDQKELIERKGKILYTLSSQLVRKIKLPYTAVGHMLHQRIENTLNRMISGVCIDEGYVKPDTIRISTYSSGTILGSEIEYRVMFNCLVFTPAVGMNLHCVVTEITKGGIKAHSAEVENSPFIAFIARDYFYDNDYFNSISEGDKITVRVITFRYELYDTYVSIIGELIRSHVRAA